MFRCAQAWETRAELKIELRGELQSILVFNHLKHAGQREYEKPDSDVNGQTQLMQQDSHVMCVNDPVRTERVWWPMGKYTDGDPNSDGKGHLRKRRVIHYQSGTVRLKISNSRTLLLCLHQIP
jgi:hypothetical protein